MHPSTDWVWMCSTNAANTCAVYVNGVNACTAPFGGSGPQQLGINVPASGYTPLTGTGEQSAWGVAELLVWNRTLTAAEFNILTCYFVGKYGFVKPAGVACATHYWPLDTSSNFVDVIGGWNGAFQGSATYATTPSGKSAVVFDGSYNSYVDLGFHSLIVSALSFVFWGRIDQLARCERFFDWGFSGSEQGSQIFFTPYCWDYGFVTPTGLIIVQRNTTVGAWVHYALTISSAGTVSMYANGALLGSSPGKPLQAISDVPSLFLGRPNAAGGSFMLYGAMSSFAIYETELTADYVAALYSLI